MVNTTTVDGCRADAAMSPCEDPVAMLDEAMALYRAKEYAAANVQFDRVLFAQPVNQEAWYYKGEVLFFLDDYWKAVECIERAIEVTPSGEDALVRRSDSPPQRSKRRRGPRRVGFRR